ncbi:mitogen-activated protein kinase 2, putative [Ichthyophthirius multifiliis]|uniref:Mitogen-activated protein kinase n=1 Tax=Ichthyophthirius multifiliis TaxID=5932 RepID=G0QWK9_ICHMU|nr:mitogen-activated protein kinase 2, putative [Ichthyophthirius multifiliis]EGR30404.1 mitogen-activated protein kinase 2, putative [Ichthyophthirius multifiliis]|eukprot:XP_004031991.1 mitogen-activated protein kinase 2, putative [Ichthyophthirius multifiliis]
MQTKQKNFSDWEVGDKYEIIKVVGSGSYGQVVEALEKSTKNKVAIKRLDGIFEDTVDCKRILREIHLLRMLNHPNLIKIIEIIKPSDLKKFDTIYVVTEYCQSDLKKLFKSPIHLQMIQIKTLTYNILTGIKYLHSSEVLHRDLKPANVLINEDCSVKICDFGLARSVEGITGAHIYDNEKEESPEKVQQQQISPEKKGLGKMQREGKLNSKAGGSKRELTGHVVTRWYRAPELILLEKDYTAAIDMWSIGCIFAELMNMIKENAPTFLDRSPLFPGGSCFPLSPDRNNTVTKSGFPHSQSDQLYVIFSVLGTPTSDEDIDFVTDQKAVEYIKSFNPKKRVDFKDIFPAATPECIDFLNRTLVFNPRKRITVDESLNHPLFKSVRDPTKEVFANGPVVLPFEKEGDMEVPRLRELFIDEIKHYHNF